MSVISQSQLQRHVKEELLGVNLMHDSIPGKKLLLLFLLSVFKHRQGTKHREKIHSNSHHRRLRHQCHTSEKVSVREAG